MQTSTARGALVVVGGVTTGVAFAPWFRTATAVGGTAGDSTAYESANAWQASTWWTAAIVLALAAVVVAVVRPGWRWVPLAATLLALGLTVWQWWRIPGLQDQLDEHGEVGWFAYDGPSPHHVGEILRDNLVLLDIEGLHQGVAWGLYAGLVALGLQTAVVAWAAYGAETAR